MNWLLFGKFNQLGLGVLDLLVGLARVSWLLLVSQLVFHADARLVFCLMVNKNKIGCLGSPCGACAVFVAYTGVPACVPMRCLNWVPFNVFNGLYFGVLDLPVGLALASWPFLVSKLALHCDA